jgi:hypothetical protein
MHQTALVTSEAAAGDALPLDGPTNCSMTRSNRNWRIYGLSILFAAVPFAFAVVRAIRTGDDFRYLWVALASLLSALVVVVVAKADRRGPIVAAARSTWVFVVATFVAVFAAWLLGARVGPGSLLIGSAFGLCYAASCALNVLARP